MPVDTVGFKLRPEGFFDRSPFSMFPRRPRADTAVTPTATAARGE